ncbi:NUDIX domain-containing protein [Sphingobacterium micropteri]|uniref:NUDIX domain-containing protein n=1 Tax=Sphingobacterium micropteri TaxID=2763501 RepID=UPI00293BD459|nr:NUDIX domain-containing protein [Sphingobacterium micropteri]
MVYNNQYITIPEMAKSINITERAYLYYMLHVTCAIIEHQGKVLICQRSASMKLSLKWEFPGGKVETGESKEKNA